MFDDVSVSVCCSSFCVCVCVCAQWDALGEPIHGRHVLLESEEALQGGIVLERARPGLLVAERRAAMDRVNECALLLEEAQLLLVLFASILGRLGIVGCKQIQENKQILRKFSLSNKTIEQLTKCKTKNLSDSRQCRVGRIAWATRRETWA